MTQVGYVGRFEADPSLVPVARRAVVQAARDFGCRSVDDVQLAASELIANAVEHGRGPVTVHATPVGGRFRIAVHDCGEGRPEVGPRRDLQDRGRGMLIIAEVAESWGCDGDGDGKTVWAEFL